MHMKKATNITLATLAAALLASSCIKEADPYEIATEAVSYTHLTLPTNSRV